MSNKSSTTDTPAADTVDDGNISGKRYSRTDSYHHGNLKEALTKAYLGLLETQDANKISMRKLATEVGVAPTAVYNHFKNKEELQIAVKIQCLNHFADYLDASAEACTDPSTSISELGKAYLQYALDYRTYFQLIMNSHVPDEYVTDELITAVMRAEAAIRNTVKALLREHGFPESQYNEGLGAFACWSVAHGITSIAETRANHVACAAGRWPPEFMLSNASEVHTSFDAIGELLVAGILAKAKR